MKIAQSSKLLGGSRKLRQELESAERALHATTRELERARKELAAQEEDKIRLETRLRLLEKAVARIAISLHVPPHGGIRT